MPWVKQQVKSIFTEIIILVKFYFTIWDQFMASDAYDNEHFDKVRKANT